MSTESLLVERTVFARRAGLQFGGDRDVWSALGYRTRPTFVDYCARYKRQDIAGTIVDRPIRATWRDLPILTDNDDEEVETPFERAWLDLVDQHRIIERFRRLDTLAALGEYAVMLIGLAGQDDFSEPLIRGAAGPEGLLYLAPYGQNNITIDRHEDDPTSPRFGWPQSYSLQTRTASGETQPTRSVRAHWSRVIHVSADNLENDVLGTPALERVLNLLDDMIKVVGGSAETFWMLAKSPLHANHDPKARPLTDPEKAEVKEQIDELQHKLRRVLFSSGMDLEYLQSSVADPRGSFDVIISLLSSATGIPKRVLIGSEAGELASSQDEKNFANRISERRTDYAEPKILRPTVGVFVESGVLPEPEGGTFEVVWGSMADADEDAKADTASKWAGAVRDFGQATNVIAPSEVRERFLDLPPELPDEIASDDEGGEEQA